MQGKIIALAVIFCFVTSFAAEKEQSKLLSVYVTTGYGIGMGARDLDSSRTIEGLNTTSREDHYQNYGHGLKLEAGAEYKLQDNLYAVGGLCYSIGVPGIKSVTTLNGAVSTVNYNWSTFGIKVMVKPTFRVLDLLDAYTTFGIGLFFASSSFDITSSYGTIENKAKAENVNSPSFAFAGGIGAEYPLNESAIAFGEILCEQMSFATMQTNYKNSSFLIGPYNSHTQFYEEDKADRNPPPKTPGTNVAFRLGVKFPIF